MAHAERPSSKPLKLVRANGLRFAYYEEGAGPLVLLLHGFPDTADGWDPVRRSLVVAGFRAVAPYMRGYAPTEVPGPGAAFDADTLGRDVLGLIGALGAEHAVLVGHDWGAEAACSAAAIAPARVRKLVTIDKPHPLSLTRFPFFLKPLLWWGHRHFRALARPSAAKELRSSDLRELDRLVRRWSPSWAFRDELTAAAKRSLRHPGSLEAALGYYRAVTSIGPTPAQCAGTSVPTVAFAGTEAIPRWAFERARWCHSGEYEVVEVPGGHFMHREHPEVFATALVRALADVKERS